MLGIFNAYVGRHPRQTQLQNIHTEKKQTNKWEMETSSSLRQHERSRGFFCLIWSALRVHMHCQCVYFTKHDRDTKFQKCLHVFVQLNCECSKKIVEWLNKRFASVQTKSSLKKPFETYQTSLVTCIVPLNYSQHFSSSLVIKLYLVHTKKWRIRLNILECRETHVLDYLWHWSYAYSLNKSHSYS